MDAYETVISFVERLENYIDKQVCSHTGTWTVHTWKKGYITYQVMMEGNYSQIITEDLFVSRRWDDEKGPYLLFHRGEKAMLDAMAAKFEATLDPEY